MSITYRAYCGPYLRCTKTFTTVEDKHAGCVNNGCPRQNKKSTSNIKFCPQCGTAIGLFVVQTKVQVGDSLDELFDGDNPFCNVFTESGPKSLYHKYDILVSNRRQEYDSNCEDEDTSRQFFVFIGDKEVCQDLTEIDPKVEIAEFEQKNIKEIAKLREVYGQNEVVVLWGFLTWGN